MKLIRIKSDKSPYPTSKTNHSWSLIENNSTSEGIFVDYLSKEEQKISNFEL